MALDALGVAGALRLTAAAGGEGFEELEDHAATSTELEQTRQSLRTALEAARQALARITSMESSKFWKLRRIWFRLKRWVGLGMNE